MKLNISPQWRIYLIILGIACGTAALTTHLLNRAMNPYRLTNIKREVGRDYIIYHDLDKDGISEVLYAYGGAEDHKIVAEDFSNHVIDQCNYREPTKFNQAQQWLFFEDYNGDNLDDVFAFTQKDDSLFLYIHDLHLKRVVLKRQFLLKAKNSVMVHPGGLLDLAGTDRKGIVFATIRGRNRGVYIFDIKERKIIKRLETNAFWDDLILYDLTGDGNKEIILSTRATGNIHEPVPYTDQKCWLFVLDQNFKPIFQPLSFGKYLSGLSCAPIEINELRYLLLYYGVGYDKSSPDLLFFVNPEGRILPQKEFKVSARHPSYRHFVVSQKKDNPEIYTWLGKKEIIKLDEKLQVIRDKETPFEEIVPVEIEDFDKDGKREILCESKEHISIFDENLELLASFPVALKSMGAISLRHRGPGQPVDIGVNGDDGFFLLVFKKNLYYSSLPFFGIGFGSLLFLLLIGSYKATSRMFIHFKYHRFSLIDSPEAVLMLDHAGIITKSNNRVTELLNVPEHMLKGKHFSEALNEVPKLVHFIQKSMISRKTIQGNIAITKGSNPIEAKVSITPIVSRLKVLNCHLVEIRGDTESALSEKLQIWSKAAAKMVHDIKYPLSIASVKLDTLRTRLEKTMQTESERIDEDIRTIRDEINRVHAITKSFLKFSDIENPTFEHIDISEIIEKAVQRFRTYTDKNLQIETEIEDGIKEVRADAQQIEFVIGALIENSIEALNGVGLVKIRAALAQYLEKSFQEMVEVEVADTGPGIPSDLTDEIFKPHVTTKAQGTGMGLAGAKKIIEDHGGTIGLYSKEGFGTVIRFSLPVYQKDHINQNKED